MFSAAVGIVFAATLLWEELAATQDPEQIQAILFPRLAAFVLVIQIVTMVFYPPFWSVTVRRLRDAGFSTVWGYGYMALDVINLIGWVALDRFQYEGGPVTQFLGILSTAYWLLLLILACFPSRPVMENTLE